MNVPTALASLQERNRAEDTGDTVPQPWGPFSSLPHQPASPSLNDQYQLLITEDSLLVFSFSHLHTLTSRCPAYHNLCFYRTIPSPTIHMHLRVVPPLPPLRRCFYFLKETVWFTVNMWTGLYKTVKNVNVSANNKIREHPWKGSTNINPSELWTACINLNNNTSPHFTGFIPVI